MTKALKAKTALGAWMRQRRKPGRTERNAKWCLILILEMNLTTMSACERRLGPATGMWIDTGIDGFEGGSVWFGWCEVDLGLAEAAALSDAACRLDISDGLSRAGNSGRQSAKKMKLYTGLFGFDRKDEWLYWKARAKRAL